MSLSEAAKLLVKARKPKRLVCPVCQVEFVGVGRRKYCSQTCADRARWRAHYWKNPERARQRAREYYYRKKAQKAQNVGAGSADQDL